jgi:hypothetical protein
MSERAGAFSKRWVGLDDLLDVLPFHGGNWPLGPFNPYRVELYAKFPQVLAQLNQSSLQRPQASALSVFLGGLFTGLTVALSYAIFGVLLYIFYALFSFTTSFIIFVFSRLTFWVMAVICALFLLSGLRSLLVTWYSGVWLRRELLPLARCSLETVRPFLRDQDLGLSLNTSIAQIEEHLRRLARHEVKLTPAASRKYFQNVYLELPLIDGSWLLIFYDNVGWPSNPHQNPSLMLLLYNEKFVLQDVQELHREQLIKNAARAGNKSGQDPFLLGWENFLRAYLRERSLASNDTPASSVEVKASSGLAEWLGHLLPALFIGVAAVFMYKDFLFGEAFPWLVSINESWFGWLFDRRLEGAFALALCMSFSACCKLAYTRIDHAQRVFAS